MEFGKVYHLPGDLKEEDFFRAVLVKLALNGDTDPEVAEVKFGEVKKSFCEVVYGELHLETDATASVGYDRQEQYQEKVRKYNSETRRYYDAYETKTRTVTDWQPFSTHWSENTMSAGLNSGDRRDTIFSSLTTSYALVRMVRIAKEKPELEELQHVVGESKDSSYGGRHPVLTGAGVDDIKSGTHAFIDYPGDHVKDIRETTDKQLLYADCYILPIYEVTFEYRGATYRAVTYGFGSVGELELEHPPAEEREDPNAVALKKTKPLKMTFVVSWILCGLAVLAQIAVFYFGIGWVGFLAIAGYVSAVVFHIIRNKKYDKIVKDMTEEFAATKRKALVSSLQKRGYPELSAREEGSFAELAKVSGNKKSDYKLSSPYVRAFIIAVVLALVLGIFMGAAASRKSDIREEEREAREAAIYTISQASAEVTDLWSGYKSAGFASGYYVDFTLNVKAKDVAIRSAETEILIYKKSGESVGTVRASLSSLNLAAGQSATEKVSLGSGGSVYNALYGKDMSAFRFEVRITQINFENGRVAR